MTVETHPLMGVWPAVLLVLIWSLAVSSSGGMDFFYSGALALITALFLAILFETFAAPSAGRGTPFASGLQYPSGRQAWQTALLFFGLNAVTVLGLVFALAKCGRPVVVGVLGFQFVLVAMRHWLWAARLVAGPWMLDHQRAVLNMAFFSPVAAGLLSGVLAWIFA